MRAAAIRRRKIPRTLENRYRIKTVTRTKIFRRQAANSGKSGEPLLHRERPHLKSRSFFKNLKSVGVT
jgi:hypothetical protein